MSEYLEFLVRLGAVEKLPDEAGHFELFRLKPMDNHLLGRLLAAERDLPEGAELVPWSSCAILNMLLEERGVAVSKEEFAGMAAVFMGFLSEGAMTRGRPPRSSPHTMAMWGGDGKMV